MNGKPGRKCSACTHERREEIDKWLEVPRTHADIVEEFGLSLAIISRHRAHILPKVHVDAANTSNNADIARNKAAAQHIADTSRDEKVRLAAQGRVKDWVELEARLALEAQSSASLPGDPVFQRVAAWLASSLCPKCRQSLLIEHDAVRGALVEPPGGVPAVEE